MVSIKRGVLPWRWSAWTAYLTLCCITSPPATASLTANLTSGYWSQRREETSMPSQRGYKLSEETNSTVEISKNQHWQRNKQEKRRGIYVTYTVYECIGKIFLLGLLFTMITHTHTSWWWTFKQNKKEIFVQNPLVYITQTKKNKRKDQIQWLFHEILYSQY